VTLLLAQGKGPVCCILVYLDSNSRLTQFNPMIILAAFIHSFTFRMRNEYRRNSSAILIQIESHWSRKFKLTPATEFNTVFHYPEGTATTSTTDDNINLLPPDRHYCDDVSTDDMLVKFFCTLFLSVRSIKCSRQIKKCVQKKLTSIGKFYASFH